MSILVIGLILMLIPFGEISPKLLWIQMTGMVTTLTILIPVVFYCIWS